MDSAENFPWIPFYQAFADALVPYRQNREELLAKLRAAYSTLEDVRFIHPDKGPFPEDTDPFTVFAQFNRTLGAPKRQAIIRALMREFDIQGKVPDSFAGIPRFDSRAAAFYLSKEKRAETDIENLWQVFTSALAVAAKNAPFSREAFCHAYDRALLQHPVNWNLTTGLFLIRPHTFLSLDSKTRALLIAHAPQFRFTQAPIKLLENNPVGDTYLTLCTELKRFIEVNSTEYSSFPEISRQAYLFIKEKEAPRNDAAPAVPEPRKSAQSQHLTGPASYTKDDFLAQTFLEPAKYDALAETLEHKKNLILQGPPGVGKTYIARRLAWALAGARDAERVRLVQFHQNTSYEDFIMGFRPVENGFKLKEGIFPTFCQQAAQDKHNNYYLIIDEINRGNTSKIFGDMFMLLEKDKRGEENGIPLLYKPEEKFSIPENLFLIGTMNTADRSLAMLDYALRRRFAFYDLEPAFGSARFRAYEQELKNTAFTALVSTVEEVNYAIADDPALGDGFRIGHSYFSNFTPETLTPAKLRSLVEHELVPLLREYWFDEREKAQTWAGRLRACLK